MPVQPFSQHPIEPTTIPTPCNVRRMAATDVDRVTKFQPIDEGHSVAAQPIKFVFRLPTEAEGFPLVLGRVPDNPTYQLRSLGFSRHEGADALEKRLC